MTSILPRQPDARRYGRQRYEPIASPRRSAARSQEQGRADLVVVANRLPGSAGSATGRGQPDSGGLVTALESLRSSDALWIGGMTDAPAAGDVQPRAGVYHVSIPAAEHSLYYDGFCNATVWPLFHDGCRIAQFRPEWWAAYEQVNRRFSQEIAARAGLGGYVWVHDYHLMLVPEMLRSLRPDLTIGFFSHIPFPPYQLLRQLPQWNRLLRGLLGSDLVGFQTEEDAAMFRSASTSVEAISQRDLNSLWDEDQMRRIDVGAFPVSIDCAGIEKQAQGPDVVGRAAQVRRDLGQPRTVLLGVDRLDYTKGIPERLAAYHELLTERRLRPGETTFVQVATPTRAGVPGYDDERAAVERAVARTLGQHGRAGVPPVHYVHEHLTRRELAALYLAADVLVATPLRDGMNLVVKEYVAAHQGTGAVVLSEFAGAAAELRDAWLVNPRDAHGLKEALLAAVTASQEERRSRMQRMVEVVRRHDVHQWAELFLAALHRTTAVERLRASNS